MKMKKPTIFFLFLMLFASVFSVSIAAQTPEENETASPAATRVEYQLPYPGMLPDHPLYKIKVLRDKIILFLIRDPIKKATRHLHMADKEFFMALKLTEKDKIPLAQHTAFKAEHHMTMLVAEIKNAVYYSDKELPQDLAQQAHRAALKHQELLAEMMDRVGKEDQEDFKIIKEFSTRNDNTLFEFEQELREIKILESDL